MNKKLIVNNNCRVQTITETTFKSEWNNLLPVALCVVPSIEGFGGLQPMNKSMINTVCV